MARAPYQVLVIPYWIVDGCPTRYAVLKREQSTGGYWQWIAGGGESGESPLEAAQREAFEEAGIEPTRPYCSLQSQFMIPVPDVCGFLWGEDIILIPEYCFGVAVSSDSIQISGEHTEFQWLTYSEAMGILRWDSNRIALWELNHRLCKAIESPQTLYSRFCFVERCLIG
jgi:dATP pyrophosphohydrolase